jgi:hypothetical protein
MKEDLREALNKTKVKEVVGCKIGYNIYGLDEGLELVSIDGGYAIYNGEEEHWYTVVHLPSLKEEGKLADGDFEWLETSITPREILKMQNKSK